MPINIKTLSPEEYFKLRWEIISATEKLRQDSYLDSVNILTMGAGFNIEVEDNLKAVLTSLGVTFNGMDKSKDDKLAA